MRPIYYDTETTGIKAEVDRIVEIAAYDPVNGQTFEKLINPGIPIPKEVSRIHNISDEMVADAPTFAELADEFCTFCQGEDVVLIAHNNDNFDIHFLKHEFIRAGREMPAWKTLDTLKWSRRYRPDLPRHTLQFLREIYGFPPNTAHRALDDVVILHKVFTCMTDDLPMETVYRLMTVERAITHMPFGKHQGKPLEEVPQEYIDWLAKGDALTRPDNMGLKKQLATLGRIKV